jgi:uncharacterized protein YkwD
MHKTLSNRLRCAGGVLAALLFAAGLVLWGVQSVAAFTGCRAENAPVVNADFENRVAQLVNEVRAANGLPPLKLTASLSAAARYHATDLGSDDYFQHDTHDRSGGGLQRVCGTFDRIRLWYNGWSAAAENIAAGYNSPEAALAAWMDSDGHRGNILNPNFTEFGVGYFTGAGKFNAYWVQDFGTRGDVTPIILAGESPVTTSRDLPVYVHGKWGQMRLRNDNGGWSDWMPFANSFTWTINAGSGQHVVSAELRSGGKTSSTCDTITLDATAAADALAPLEPDKVTSKLYLPAVKNGLPITCAQ